MKSHLLAVVLTAGLLAGCGTIDAAKQDIANLHKGEAIASAVIDRAAPVNIEIQQHVAKAKHRLARLKHVGQKLKADLGAAVGNLLPHKSDTSASAAPAEDAGMDPRLKWMIGLGGLAVFAAAGEGLRRYLKKRGQL